MQTEGRGIISVPSVSAGDMHTRTLNAPVSPGRSVCHSPTLDTPAARCGLLGVKSPFPHLAQAPGGTHIYLHTGMTKLPSFPSSTFSGTTQTPPHPTHTFISTLRADGTLISVTLIEMGFFTVPSKEQFPNSTRELAGGRKKNDGE